MRNDAPRAAKKKGGPTSPTEYPIEQAALIEYLFAGAVTELLISEFGEGTYRLEVSLSWKSGKGILMAARGAQRTFRSLDTLANFIRSVGIGATVVRMELKP